MGAVIKLPAGKKKQQHSKKPTKPVQFLGTPSMLACCRNVVDGDLVAAVFLYRVLGLWKFIKSKLERSDREWIAMSRDDWARSAGLTIAELKNRALPRLRQYGSGFIVIKTMRLSPSHPNVIWISLDVDAMRDALSPWDMYEPILNGFKGIGQEKGIEGSNSYPYKQMK